MENQHDSTQQSLYAKHETIHPRHVTGLFATCRVSAVVVLMGIYYGLPWLQWDDRQAVLFDLPARKFHIFSITLWPQDFIYLAALLIVAALSLFFFTAVAGRLWCGFACPQTVWTEVFMWIERKIEGDRNRRIKLDKSPNNRHKIVLKTVKHCIWILLSLWTGYTFVGYFTPIVDLGHKILMLDTGPWEGFWVLFYGFATYGNAGWMREQVCLYMCPYARFQSAMFDQDTLIISYDTNRGEPRGHRKRHNNVNELGLGSCIDCKLCVQVCPTGIDIRDGLQYQCIGCAACIDVCDDVMEKMSYPKGLIRYTTENMLSSGTTRLLRLKVIVYGFILLFVCSLLVYGLLTRDRVDIDVIRDRNVLYRVTNEGLAENIYTIKILNKDDRDHNFIISVTGLPEIRLRENKAIFVPSGHVEEAVIAVLVDPVDMKSLSADISIKIVSKNNPDLSALSNARYLKPR